MMKFTKTIFTLLLLTLCLTAAAQKTHTIELTVTEKATREPVIMATVQLQPIGVYAVTDLQGKAKLTGVPAGQYTMTVSYVGFETVKQPLRVNSNVRLKLQMTETSLALNEVTVVARQNASGTSTSSIIGRQAIDHLQATSLADVMQLVPGHLMGNVDLTSQQNLQVRQLSNNNTAAFGASVVVDGVPISNNGSVAQGDFSATAFAGTDLRQVSADDIDEVEVVRGIPSAEYGDLSSGMVVVHSKVGVTPWQVKGKVNPGLMNYSVGKGLRMDKAGVLNFNLDYAQAWGDPRQKTRSYDRYSLSAGYGIDISRRWHTDTKLRYSMAKDWSGKDPDAIQDGTESKNRNQTFSLTHNGKIKVDRLLSRNISYTVGLSLTMTDASTTSFAGSGLTPIITARETGYYNVPWETSSYLATGKTESRPGNFYAKVNNSFFLRKGKTYQSFKMGVDYKYDWNSGAGYYNTDDRHPLRPNSGGRPRAFSDVPGLHQVAAFAEDNLSWNYAGKRNLRLQAGARFTAMQPFSNVRTFALSPRLNMTVELTDWLNLRGGIGLNSKTPGLNYLYPDKHYSDQRAAQYMPQPAASATDAERQAVLAQQLINYHTFVYDVAYSRNLKNATTVKVEGGVDIKLPGGRTLSILAYEDRTRNGFGPQTEYITYDANYFDEQHGLVITPGQPTTIDYANPARTVTYWSTTGKVGNTDVSINRGVEFDFDLGRINPLNTHVYLSGAWQESKSYSKNLNSANPTDNLVSYTQYSTSPIKMVWPAQQDYSRYRRFVNTIRLVTNIPQLRMVASFTGQVIWHNSNLSYVASKNPIGWFSPDTQASASPLQDYRPAVFHELTADMLGGYIGTDGQYYATLPAGMQGISIEKQIVTTRDNVTTKNPVTWNLSARLTKEFGKVAGLSFYANNVLFYEPFMTSSTSSTLTQRNTGNFSFGVELFFNL